MINKQKLFSYYIQKCHTLIVLDTKINDVLYFRLRLNSVIKITNLYF